MKCRCEFINGEHVMPGWICCACRGYNGMQRLRCRHCDHERRPLVVPDGVRQCPKCGWAWEGALPTASLAGEMKPGICPSCAHDGVTTPIGDT